MLVFNHRHTRRNSAKYRDASKDCRRHTVQQVVFVLAMYGITIGNPIDVVAQLPAEADRNVSSAVEEDGDVTTAAETDETTVAANEERVADWAYMAPVMLPTVDSSGTTPTLFELRLGPEQFTHARFDLADLRLFTSAGQAQPFALRVLAAKSVRDEVPAEEFNRLDEEDGTHELTLELLSDQYQHNEVQVETTGDTFRRAVQVDGSEDGQTWRSLSSGHLLRFEHGEQKMNVSSVTYADSRLKFVRVRVQSDLDPVGPDPKRDEFEISSVKVLRTVEVPGERSQWPAVMGPREPTRVLGSPGSAWIIDLKGRNVPVDRVEFEVENSEFVRDVELQVEAPSDYLGQPVFTSLYSTEPTTWQRKAGEPKQKMVLEFSETYASRLRLLVCDYRNAPLTIQSATVSAAARQLLIPTPDSNESQLTLYLGNPSATEPANYDFARNLPERLDTKPALAELGSVTPNPDYVQPPLPLTERYPWLVYGVLGAVVVVLLLIISRLAKTAVTLHDAAT